MCRDVIWHGSMTSLRHMRRVGWTAMKCTMREVHAWYMKAEAFVFISLPLLSCPRGSVVGRVKTFWEHRPKRSSLVDRPEKGPKRNSSLVDRPEIHKKSFSVWHVLDYMTNVQWQLIKVFVHRHGAKQWENFSSKVITLSSQLSYLMSKLILPNGKVSEYNYTSRVSLTLL